MNAELPSPPPVPSSQRSNGNRLQRNGRSGTGGGQAARPGRPVHPVLEQLAALHPQLFGARFLPLKLGTFQDLMERHPGVFDAPSLKEALGQHTRSTRYLDSIARGLQRHDLDGQPVGDLAVDHVHHAVVELGKRQQARGKDGAEAATRGRIRSLFAGSGLDRPAYAAAAKVNLDLLNAQLDQADLDQADDIARREALMRTYEGSGLTPQAFAETYGMDLRLVTSTMAQAATDRRIKASR